LLLEAFADPAIDKIVVIDCTEEQQVARFGQKGGTAEEARRRMAAQMPRAERLARADYIIEASGSIDETLRQVDHLYEQLRNLK
jgi:dephospho-CoA kinase